MMQQSVGQDQIGLPSTTPQMAQMTQQGQMMYCPVRLVYDPATSMVMQQGDQIQQQNQNMFVNQPPWARPVQNQVIYVQQIGSNYVPIQQMDQNIYIQQNPFSGMPQMVQNIQNVPQGQMRQMMGSVPANMMPNFVSNMQGFTIDQATGQLVPNYGFLQANHEVNIANNIVNSNAATHDDNRQVVTNQALTQNVLNQDMQTQIYRQMVTQMNQQQPLVRPQTPMTLSQMQNLQNLQTIQQHVGVNVAQMNQNIGANVTQIAQNIGGNTSQVAQNVVPQSHNNITGNVRQNLVTNIAPSLPPNVGQINNSNIRPNTNVNILQNHPNIPVNTNAIRPNTESNMVANISQNMTQIRQAMSPQTINMMARNAQQNLANATERSIANNVNNVNTVLYSAVRNGQPYTYRVIQPKPNVRLNVMPRSSQNRQIEKTKTTAPSIGNTNPSKIDTSIPTSLTNVRPSIGHGSPIPSIPITNIKVEQDNTNVNRKRKSESPDEIHKKISNFGSITVKTKVIDRIKAKYGQTSEIGTNISPVHKPVLKKENQQQPMLQINPIETKIKEEYGKPTETGAGPKLLNNETDNAKLSNAETANNKTESKDVSQQTDSQILVRKTVFPQARGRLLDDRANEVSKSDNNSTSTVTEITQVGSQTSKLDINPIKNPNVNFKETKNTQEKLSILDTKVVCKDVEMQDEDSKKLIENKNSLPLEQNKADSKTLVDKKETTGIVIKTEEIKDNSSKAYQSNNDIKLACPVKKDKELKVESNTEVKASVTTKLTDDIKMDTTETKITTDFEKVIQDTKIEKKEYKNISISEMTGKEIHIVDGNIHKKERDYVLTHVLDGYVIQESNVPFAIRKPLKEKTINAVTDENPEPGVKKDEIKDKIYDLSQLNINEQKEKDRQEKEDAKNLEVKEMESETNVEKKEDIVEKDDPFRGQTLNVVKSWTVDQLSSHLTKHNWTETVSTLQEHEIDGESLLLVTRSQLVTIGISEEHAGIICEFVQKN